jgi:hypothetical protein
VHLGKAGSILQFTVDLVFVAELGAPGSVFFKLDGDLQKEGIIIVERSKTVSAGQQLYSVENHVGFLLGSKDTNARKITYLLAIGTDTEVNITKGSTSYPLCNAVFL